MCPLNKRLGKTHHDHQMDLCLLQLSNCWKFQRFNHFQLWEDSSEHLDFKIPLHSISLPYYGIIWMNNRFKPNCWFMGHTVYSTLGCLSWVPFHFSFLFSFLFLLRATFWSFVESWSDITWLAYSVPNNA